MPPFRAVPRLVSWRLAMDINLAGTAGVEPAPSAVTGRRTPIRLRPLSHWQTPTVHAEGALYCRNRSIGTFLLGRSPVPPHERQGIIPLSIAHFPGLVKSFLLCWILWCMFPRVSWGWVGASVGVTGHGFGTWLMRPKPQCLKHCSLYQYTTTSCVLPDGLDHTTNTTC